MKHIVKYLVAYPFWYLVLFVATIATIIVVALSMSWHIETKSWHKQSFNILYRLWKGEKITGQMP